MKRLHTLPLSKALANKVKRLAKEKDVFIYKLVDQMLAAYLESPDRTGIKDKSDFYGSSIRISDDAYRQIKQEAKESDKAIYKVLAKVIEVYEEE